MFDGQAVWDTLAIAETVAELYPDKQLWPQDAKARRVARSACAEMHSGFSARGSASSVSALRASSRRTVPRANLRSERLSKVAARLR